LVEVHGIVLRGGQPRSPWIEAAFLPSNLPKIGRSRRWHTIRFASAHRRHRDSPEV
jgi:hypothetical protein